MKYTKIKMDNYNIHLIKTNKFKKTVVMINFKNNLKEDEILKRRLIPGILVESNAKYKTKRELDIMREELYGLSTYGNVSMSGKSIYTSFGTVFLNDKYVPGLFKEAFDFLYNMIFNPSVEKGGFNKEAFKLKVSLMKEEYELSKEDPSYFSTEQVYKTLGRGTELEYSYFGDIDNIDKLTPKSVYEYYKYMIDNDKVDIFICGDVDDSVIDIIKKKIKINNKRENSKHYISFNEFNKKPIKLKDIKPYNQSTLILGYRLDDLTSYERDYVLPIYSYILGGGPDSKLFKNVREKNSLCYSISCVFRKVSNVMMIKSGINASSYNKALKLINEEVEKMSEGKFNKIDIDKAKITYMSVFEEVFDNPHTIIDNYVSNEYLGSDLISKRKRIIKKVSKKDIMQIIPKIHLDVIYLLEGSEEVESK